MNDDYPKNEDNIKKRQYQKKDNLKNKDNPIKKKEQSDKPAIKSP